jgi:hypothetical protein
MQDATRPHKAALWRAVLGRARLRRELARRARQRARRVGILAGNVNQPLPDPSPLNDALRRAHRSALVSVAICAIAIGVMMLASETQSDGEVERVYSLGALGLAALSMLARRGVSPGARNLRGFVYASLASLLGAVGLGVLGIVVAARTEEFSVGLLYALAGALLLLRPPPRLVAPTAGDD